MNAFELTGPQGDSNFDGNSGNQTRRNRTTMRLAADSVIDLRSTTHRQQANHNPVGFFVSAAIPRPESRRA